jgi:hypothetical protein
LIVCCLLALVACKTNGGEQASVKDLPDFLQPDRILAYKDRSPAELDALFKGAPSPTEFPSGHASGIHLIPPGTQAQVPTTLTVVTKTLWKGKTFDGSAGIMTDEVFGPNLGIGAQLRLESITDTLKRYGWDGLDSAATVDDRPSLITDYKGYRMLDAPSVLTKDTKGWVDECRIVEAEAPPVWLCRSTYDGMFWGHVVLQMQ